MQAQAKEFGVVVEKVYFVNEMRLPAEVIASINKKLAANQIAAQKQNELASAIADAEKVKAAAEGEKQAAILKAQGESEALRILGDALRQNPNVAELRAIEKWDGKLPQTMVPNASTPFGSGIVLCSCVPWRREDRSWAFELIGWPVLVSAWLLYALYSGYGTIWPASTLLGVS